MVTPPRSDSSPAAVTRKPFSPARPSFLGVIGALALVSIAFGGNFLAIRIVVHLLPPFSLQAIRFLTAGVVLYGIAAYRTSTPKPNPRQWRAAFIGGGFLLLGGQGGVSWSEQYVSAGIGALLVATVPLWVAIFGAVALQERIRPLGIVGIALGFIGLIPIVLPHGTSSSGATALAILALASISWSVGSIFGARVRVHDDAFVATAMQLLTGGVLLSVAALITGEPDRIAWSAIDSSVLWGMAYLILIGGVIGYAAYVWLLKAAPPSIAAMFAYLAPIVTLFLGFLLHEETLATMTIVGALVILVGVALVIVTRNSEISGNQ